LPRGRAAQPLSAAAGGGAADHRRARGPGRQRRADHPPDRRAGIQPRPARRPGPGRTGGRRARSRRRRAARGLRRAPRARPRAHAGVLRRAGAAHRQSRAAAASAAQPGAVGAGPGAVAAGIACRWRDGLPRRRAGAVPRRPRMRRRVPHDVAVVGGGAVGAACALALAREGLDVRLLDAARLPAWSAGDPDLRVYALAPDNVALLDSLEVWDAVRAARAQPYRRMEVWDAAGGEPIVFDADALARPGLGWIVENRLLVDMLWRALKRTGVQVSCPARVEALEQGAEAAGLRLEDGTAVAAPRRCGAWRGSAPPSSITASRAWSGTCVPRRRTRTPPGSASCPPARWRCCPGWTAPARSSGPCPRTSRRGSSPWTTTRSPTRSPPRPAPASARYGRSAVVPGSRCGAS